MEIKSWTYDEFPAFAEEVAGARRIATTGDERGVRYLHDVPYAERDGMTLHLQILRPGSRNHPDEVCPCVVYVQGSAWGMQDVWGPVPQLARLAARGYVVAIVEYRPAPGAHFPAQVLDALDAIRFMRRNAATYAVDPDRIVVAGSSSGGHTAVFCGIMAGEALEEGEEAGTVAGTSARVSGIIDLYGAVSLMHDDGFPTTVNHHLPSSPEGRLMGADLRAHPELRAQASVTCRITAELAFPPVLIAHGTKDRTVSTRLSVELYEHLRALGKDAELYLLEGADHGGPEFFTESMCDVYDRFMRRCFAECAAAGSR